MGHKQGVVEDLIDIKNKIFESKASRINLERETEEIQEKKSHLLEDIEVILEQMQENSKRKHHLSAQVNAITSKFKDEAAQIKQDLASSKKKLVMVFAHKEKVEDQGEFLIHDRGAVGSVRKYGTSIGEFITLAKILQGQFENIHDNFRNFGDQLKIDAMYYDEKTNKMKVLKDLYKVGKYAENEKKDLIHQDLQKKQEYIIELLNDKEQIEENLACFGCIHNIYVSIK